MRRQQRRKAVQHLNQPSQQQSMIRDRGRFDKKCNN